MNYKKYNLELFGLCKKCKLWIKNETSYNKSYLGN
jgi:hypothetical protein